MKPEFPTLISVRDFMSDLSASELRRLVRLNNERAFEIEVRRIRLCHRLKTFLPAVSPERLSATMAKLTPEQICGVDRGQIQIGTLLDVESLTGDEGANGYSNTHRSGYESSDDFSDSDDSQYEHFGNSTVQVRIDKQALGKQTSTSSLSDTMRDFAQQIETLLKTSG